MSYCSAGFACICSVRESFSCSNQKEGEPSPEFKKKQDDYYAKIASQPRLKIRPISEHPYFKNKHP